MQFTIRPACADDIPALRTLAERTWRVSYAALLTPAQIDYMLAWMYAPEQIARELREGVAWELALAESEPAGFFSLTLDEGPRAKLNKLYVLPELQGQGLGRALLARAEELAAARGAREMWLQVNKRNERARATYERAGYTIERADVFDIGGGFVMDDFIMRRTLPPRSAA
jgi:ribosomal protein S18 acetylase RimI-like enzyme